MANALITHSCGHEEHHALYGNSNERARRESWLETTLCTECWRVEQEAKRRAENAASAAANAELALPPLTGSEKQVAWAETLRAVALQDLARAAQTNAQAFLCRIPDHEDRAQALKDEGWKTTPEQRTALAESLTDLTTAWCASHTSAHWWIENRNDIERLACTALAEPAWTALLAIKGGSDALASAEMARREAEEAERLRKEEASRQAQLKREAAIEATIVPENAVTTATAVITLHEGVITIRTTEFIEALAVILRAMNFEWKNRQWTRKPALPQERAIETAHRLLAAGIPVRLYDPEMRRRAVAGEYEPECTRNVMRLTSGKRAGWFGIRWRRSDGDFYPYASCLHGARWSPPYMAVPPGSYEEVQDFAAAHGFKLSVGAIRLIAEQKEMLERAITVAPLPARAAAVPALPQNGSPSPLPIPESVEVDPSLIDEEEEAAPCA